MIKVDVFVKNKNWKRYISNPKNYLNNNLKYLKRSIVFLKRKKLSFSILLAGNNEIKILNKKFRGKNKTTDVLSFPYHEAFELKKNKNTNVYLGDVILNYNKINKKNFKKDFNKLWVHGFLHLIGYTHKKDKDYYKMSNIEKKILNKIKN